MKNVIIIMALVVVIHGLVNVVEAMATINPTTLAAGEAEDGDLVWIKHTPNIHRLEMITCIMAVGDPAEYIMVVCYDWELYLAFWNGGEEKWCLVQPGQEIGCNKMVEIVKN